MRNQTANANPEQKIIRREKGKKLAKIEDTTTIEAKELNKLALSMNQSYMA